MANKHTVLNLVAIALLALVVRASAAWLQSVPVNIDEAYHYINALTLAQGGGLTENFIWNYLYRPDTVSHSGFLYWMPLTSLIASLGLMVGDFSYDSAQWGFVLLSSLLPVICFIIALDISKNIRHANFVALLMIFSGHYFGAWTVTDSFTPYTLSGILAVYSFSRLNNTGHISWGFVSGVMVGLANLARPDAPLLIVTFFLITVFGSLKPRHNKEISQGANQPYRSIVAILIGFFLAMGPWYAHNLATIGEPLASAGLKTAWLCNYEDFFSYGKELSPSSYMACGWGNILQSKWLALISICERLAGEQGLVFALPLAAIGWWTYRSKFQFRVILLYGILLFISMTLIFTFPGPRGSWFHSAGILLPFIYTAAAQGLDTTIEFMARRWPGWADPGTKPFFSVLLVVLSIVLSLLAFNRSIQQQSDSILVGNAYTQAVAAIDEKATVMVADTTLFMYHGGWQAIALPSNGTKALLEAADAYSSRYLLLDSNAPKLIGGIYLGKESHPRLILANSFSGNGTPIKLYRIEALPNETTN